MMNLEDCSIEFQYTFSSGLGAYDEGRFVKDHFLQINLSDETGEVIENIGSLRFVIIYMDRVFESPHSFYDVLDAHSEYLARHIFKVVNCDNGDLDDKILSHYNYDIMGSNICFIENMQILPQYRCFQIGAKAIKDLLFHYASGCALFMLQPYPLQFETAESVQENHLLELEKFGKDENKALVKLKTYYQNIGFEEVKGIQDLLFYNPALQSNSLDSINLEDYDIFKKS